MASRTHIAPGHPPDGAGPIVVVSRSGLSRFDLVLVTISAAFLFALVVAAIAGVPLRGAMGAAAAVGAVVLADGLVINPPRRPRSDAQ